MSVSRSRRWLFPGSDLVRDVRLGLRMLAKRPAVTVVAVAALALAIGATSTTFSVVNALLLKPLPFEEPGRLVAIWQVDPVEPETWRTVSFGNFVDWRREARSFESVAAASNRSYTLSSLDEPETPLMRQVSRGYFETLGIEPHLGRTPSVEEDQPGGPKVLLLSYEVWQSHFGADRDIVGASTELDGVAHEIIGVMPPGFDNPVFGTPVPPWAWIPLAQPETGADHSGFGNLVVARLAPGVSLAQAREEFTGLSARLRELYPEENHRVEALVTPLGERLLRNVRSSLLLLQGAVLFVLLVACGNVANLLLTRALERRREMAVRRALGAGLRQLVRQLVAESVILTLAGGLLGLALAFVGVRWVEAQIPTAFGIPAAEISVDATVLGFTLVLSLVTGMVFGLVPAVYAMRGNLESALSVGAARSVGDTGSQRLRRGLVIAEVALSLVLLIGAGLMVQSSARLQALDPGFEIDGVLTFRTSTRGADYTEGSARAAFFQRVQDELAVVPGIERVGGTQALPFFGQFVTVPMSLDSQPPAEPGTEPRVLIRRVLPGFFDAMGIPLEQGRDVTLHDTAEAPQVVVVNRALVRQFFPETGALEQSVTLHDETATSRRIVGVVADTRTDSIPPEPRPTLFLPLAQDPSPTSLGWVVAARSGDPRKLLPAIKSAVRRVDSRMPVYVVRPLEEVIAIADWRPRFLMSLLGTFAVLALSLAATGIYAVLAYAVSRRSQEIGIRMALGAQRGDVLALVLKGGLAMAAVGIALGLAGAFGLSRLLSSQLYGVTASDPGTYAALSGVLLAVVLAASLIPAWRAARVDPVKALQR